MVRAVALFEAAKGAIVLLAGFGVLAALHLDVQRIAEALIAHLHLNAAGRFPRIFLDAAANLTNARLWLLALLAAAYTLIRFVEAYGLWHGRRWAEWFAAASAGLYVPFELYELSMRFTWLALAALVINILIVALMIGVLHRARPAEPADAA
jgi:uncharacterized membrane protein (DUF2068 family)